MKHIDLKKFERILLDAGDIIRFAYYEIRENQIYEKNPVTETDLLVHSFLKQQLPQLIPNSFVLSEEDKEHNSQLRLNTDWTWIIDPIDGTKEFVNKIPEFAVSIGLVKKSRVVLGGLLNPITGEYGISSLGEPILFCGFPPRKSSDMRITLSRSEFNKEKYQTLIKQIPNIYAIGSVAYKLLRLAARADDLYLSFEGKNEWDICGGVGLLEMADQSYIRFDGKPNRFNQNHLRIECGAIAGEKSKVQNFLQKFPQIFTMLGGSNEYLYH